MTHSATRPQKAVGRLNSVVMPLATKLLNLRIVQYDRGTDPASSDYDEHAIFTFWHEHIGIVLPHWRHTPITILVSRHRDGEWVTQSAENFGFNIVRGSTSRGGSSAIRQLKKSSTYSSIGMSPDGPRGPRRKMAMGPIFLSALLGLPIVPVGIGVNRAWRMNTWDRFLIPKPFSRIRMVLGPKIHVPRNCSRADMEAKRQSVERLVNQLCDVGQHWADSGKKMVGERRFKRAGRRSQIQFPARQPQTANPRNVDDASSKAA